METVKTETQTHYKYCIVPKCTNTSVTAPDKHYFTVPKDKKLRDKWCKVMKRTCLSEKSVRYCCEDHFNVEEDTENFMRHRLVGGRLFLKKNVLPHKFACQRAKSEIVHEKPTFEKRRRMEYYSQELTIEVPASTQQQPEFIECTLTDEEQDDDDPLSVPIDCTDVNTETNVKLKTKNKSVQVHIKDKSKDKGCQTISKKKSGAKQMRSDPCDDFDVSLNEAMKIGFIGGGRLAFALANGFISAGLAKPDEITASCHPADTVSADAFKGLGATTFFENKPVVDRSEVVIVSTKPDVVVPALREFSSDPAVKSKLFISVAMGISIATIEKVLPPDSRVIRVMPNTPALVQQGAAALSRGSKATPEDARVVTKLFSSVGTCDEVPEYQMDAVTALSGSGPAYIFMLIEALAEGGVRCGLPRDLALRLASQTTLGAAAMVKNGGHPATLKDNVTSPAGSTADGTYHLEKNGFRAAVIGAVAAAADRCKVVNEKLNN